MLKVYSISFLMMPVFVVIVIIFYFEWHSPSCSHPPRAWIWRIQACRHIQFIEMDSIQCDLWYRMCMAYVTALPQRFSLFSARWTCVNFRDGLPIWGTNSKYAFRLQSHSISWDPSSMTHWPLYSLVGPVHTHTSWYVCANKCMRSQFQFDMAKYKMTNN